MITFFGQAKKVIRLSGRTPDQPLWLNPRTAPRATEPFLAHGIKRDLWAKISVCGGGAGGEGTQLFCHVVLGAFGVVDERGWSGVRPDGRLTFLACPRKVSKRRAPRPVRPLRGYPALLVGAGGVRKLGPSGLRQAHPETPAPPALLGSLHGDPGWCRGRSGLLVPRNSGMRTPTLRCDSVF